MSRKHEGDSAMKRVFVTYEIPALDLQIGDLMPTAFKRDGTVSKVGTVTSIELRLTTCYGIHVGIDNAKPNSCYSAAGRIQLAEEVAVADASESDALAAERIAALAFLLTLGTDVENLAEQDTYQ